MAWVELSEKVSTFHSDKLLAQNLKKQKTHQQRFSNIYQEVSEYQTCKARWSRYQTEDEVDDRGGNEERTAPDQKEFII